MVESYICNLGCNANYKALLLLLLQCNVCACVCCISLIVFRNLHAAYMCMLACICIYTAKNINRMLSSVLFYRGELFSNCLCHFSIHRYIWVQIDFLVFYIFSCIFSPTVLFSWCVHTYVKLVICWFALYWPSSSFLYNIYRLASF